MFNVQCSTAVSTGRPLTMRCLPSFLVLGAQKAGSTDLRGLLSFHPFLDGPSSEVRGHTEKGCLFLDPCHATLLPATKQLLDALFCDYNQDLAHLLNDDLGLKGGAAAGGVGSGGGERLLLPRHGYASVE